MWATCDLSSALPVYESSSPLPPHLHYTPPHVSPTLTGLSSCGSCASVSSNLTKLLGRAGMTLKVGTMGWQERRWLVCATFLGFFLVSPVWSITRSELFSYGGDQLLEPGNDQTHRVELDQPVLFYDGTFDSIYVSSSSITLTITWEENSWNFLDGVDSPRNLRNCAFPGKIGVERRSVFTTSYNVGN